jgi:uncharacterized membrane protein
MIVWAMLVVIVIAVLMSAAAFVMEKLIPGERRRKHNDVIGFVYAVVGVAYAVLLGLVVIAAWNTLDVAKANTYAETNALIQLDWYGHSLPQPEHARIEGLVQEYTTVVITTEWPRLAHQEDSERAWAVYTNLRAVVQASGELGNARRERINQAAEGIPALLWTALVVGGIITIGFPLFFGMKSTVAHAFVMFSLTLLIGSLLLVVFELNYPFAGIVSVSPEAFRLALERMQQLS